MSDLPYRPNVGAVLFNPAGLVFVARRADMPNAEGPAGGWQLPQGGIDEGEDPRTAVLRELEEEIGTRKAEVIGEHPEWLTYDLPPNLLGIAWRGRYRGQRQRWFAMRFTGQGQRYSTGPRSASRIRRLALGAIGDVAFAGGAVQAAHLRASERVLRPVCKRIDAVFRDRGWRRECVTERTRSGLTGATGSRPGCRRGATSRRPVPGTAPRYRRDGWPRPAPTPDVPAGRCSRHSARTDRRPDRDRAAGARCPGCALAAASDATAAFSASASDCSARSESATFWKAVITVPCIAPPPGRTPPVPRAACAAG